MASRNPSVLLRPSLGAALRGPQPHARALSRLEDRSHALEKPKHASPVQRRRLWLPSFPGAASPPHAISTRRTLPYSPSQVYQLIADIDSYSGFVPFCSTSKVTHWTRPDASGKRWPARADLTVGWGPFTENYTSRVYCIPGSVVEAVSGAARTSLPAVELEKHGRDSTADDGAAGVAGGIFDSLVTRWTVHPRGNLESSETAAGGPRGQSSTESTDVTLSVRFQFANPALGFAVGNVADDMANQMVRAFEERARKLYEKR